MCISSVTTPGPSVCLSRHLSLLLFKSSVKCLLGPPHHQHGVFPDSLGSGDPLCQPQGRTLRVLSGSGTSGPRGAFSAGQDPGCRRWVPGHLRCKPLLCCFMGLGGVKPCHVSLCVFAREMGHRFVTGLQGNVGNSGIVLGRKESW